MKGGSRTETPTLSGLSHYYEHLIFRGGSAKQGELQFRKEMQRIGDESGGYTTNDWTCYGFTAPTQNLDEALWRSVDAWMGLQLTQAKVDKERQVVMEEYNQGEDRPDYKVYYQIERLMFRDHPYKRDTIGLKEAILHSSLATFRTFYEERYVPNQIILAAVGDFDTKTLHAKLAKAFAPYKRGKDDFELGDVEKPQTEFRMGVETLKTPNTQSILGFHMPPHASPDTPALTVLESLLGGGTSSRLYRALKEKENLAIETSADLEVRRDPGMFCVYTTVQPANEAKVFGVVRDELKRLANELVPAAELDRVKSQLVNAYVFDAQTPFSRAERLCLNELMSDVTMEALWPRLLQSVTAEDVRRVVRTYFTADLASYSVVRPEGTTGPSEAEIRGMLDSWRAGWPSGTVVAQTAGAKVRKEVLPNGVTLLLKEDHAIPIVAVETVARGGLWIEPAGKGGVSNMAMTLLRRGAGARTAREISDRAASLGMRLGTGGEEEWGSVTWQAPSANFDAAWSLYRDVLLAPTFPAEEVRKVREDLIQQAKSLGDRPFEYTNAHFYRVLYPKSPYGRQVLGDTASLAAITAADLRRAYDTMICGSNLIVSVVGDFDANALLATATKTFGTLKKGVPVEVGGAKDEPAAAAQPIFETKEQEQITYNTGWLGCSVRDPDYPALRVATALIGDKLFFKYVYEKGVAYRSWFYMADRMGQSSVQNEMGVTPSNFAMASTGVLGDVEAFQKTPPTAAEVKNSVDKSISRHILRSQENRQLASRLAYWEMTGLGWEFGETMPEKLRAVTPEQVRDVMKKYFRLDGYTRVAVGRDPSKVEAKPASTKPAP
ncbi:MAG TPA: pitrilysin family protein [Candidatus Eisenbacteria bacterium]|nr:pitrilysin family protein [Candidatus Eisenbacteria bacterium]